MNKGADIYSVLCEPQLMPELRMFRLAFSGIAAQAVYTFAALGLPDLLKDGPKAVSELATQTQTHQRTLYRILRFLDTIDVVDALEDSQFRLTRLGRTLCAGSRSAIRDNALLMCSPMCWNALGGLFQQAKTGQNAFERAFGTEFFAYIASDQSAERCFSAAMDSSTELGVADVLSMYDFSRCQHIVDVGGGKGALLRAVLRKYPVVCGTSYDAEAVLRAVVEDGEIGTRLSRIPGNFFESVPPGADTYVLRRVLHDWDDEKAIQILRACRKAMSRAARLLIIELSPETSRNNWAGLDLLMMVLLNGKERTEKDFAGILSEAELELVNVHKTDSSHWIVEAAVSS